MSARYAGIGTRELHHAYVLRDDAVALSELIEHIMGAVPNAETVHIAADVFGVDESRALFDVAQRRSAHAKVFILETNGLTREAQNALLKLFEEPPQHTHFFVCVPNASALLPTLLSRVREVWVERALVSGSEHDAFLSLSLKERLLYLEPIIKEKDTHKALALLDTIEKTLYDAKAAARFSGALQHVIATRAVLSTASAPLKVPLESVALAVPRL